MVHSCKIFCATIFGNSVKGLYQEIVSKASASVHQKAEFYFPTIRFPSFSMSHNLTHFFHTSQLDSYYMSGQTDMVLLAHFRASVEAGNIMKSQHAPWLLCKSRDKGNTIQQPLTVQGADLG